MIVKDSWSPDVVPSYGPTAVEIKPNTTVTWTHEDFVAHTVTDKENSFDSGFISTGNTWSYKFEKQGEFDYFCTLHPWMQGIVSIT